jgi:hypothetical protein
LSEINGWRNMTTCEILQQLRQAPNHADFGPYEAALRAAIEHREAITPELIAAIDRVSDDPAHYLKDEADWLHLFALCLLAPFREPRALDAFIRFFSLPGEQSLDLTGDMITNYGAAVLASVCGGDPAPLLKLAQDESINEFVRQQAIDGLLVQAGWGERPRAAVVEDLRGLFRTLPKPGKAYMWAALVGAVCDFNEPALAPEALQAFAEGLVDEEIIDRDCFEDELFPGTDTIPFVRGEDRFAWFCERNAPIDAVGECSGWVCFKEDKDDLDERPGEDADLEDGLIAGPILPLPEVSDVPKPMPYLAPPKVGRNDPCPCGSGKKHKKCCGPN